MSKPLRRIAPAKAEFGHVGRAQIGKERTEPLQPRRDIGAPGAAGLAVQADGQRGARRGQKAGQRPVARDDGPRAHPRQPGV